MKFNCDNCSTQYLISDDKIGPKGVKVRCKRCGNVIVVRPGEQSEADGGDRQQDAIATDNEGVSFEPESQAQSRDEVGDAFDQLLQGGLEPDDDFDDSVDEDDDEQATEVFRMNKFDQGADDVSDQEKIDQVFAGAESTELNRPDPEPQANEHGSDIDWYVAIGDDQVGPMELSEVESRWADGEIQAETLAWHSGLSDWAPVSDIPQLKHLSDSQPAGARESTEVDAPEEEEQPALTSSAPAAADWAPQTSSELSSLVEEEMAAGAVIPPDEDSDLADEPDDAASVLGDDGEVPPWEMDDPPSGEVAQPSESFFDSSLDKDSGAEDEGYLNGTYSRSGRVLAGPAYLGSARKSDSKMKWVLIGVLSLLILGGGTVLAIVLSGEDKVEEDKTSPVDKPAISDAGTTDQNGKQPPEIGPGKKPDNAVPDKKPADSGQKADAGVADGGSSDNREMVVKNPGVVPDKKPPRVSDGKPEKTPGSKGRKRRKKRKVVAVTPKPDKAVPVPDKTPPAADSSLPKKLSKAQISKTMKKYIKSMRSCVEQQRQRDPSVTGTMKVSFVIQPSGSVNSITVKTSEHKGTYVAGCISFIIKSMKFPRAQESFTVPVLPLKLGG